MTACITADNRFERSGGISAMACPQCAAVVPMSVTAFPPFSRLKAKRPAQIGVVLQCSACKSPVFLRYRTRAWRDDRVELHPLPQPVEHLLLAEAARGLGPHALGHDHAAVAVGEPG